MAKDMLDHARNDMPDSETLCQEHRAVENIFIKYNYYQRRGGRKWSPEHKPQLYLELNLAKRLTWQLRDACVEAADAEDD